MHTCLHRMENSCSVEISESVMRFIETSPLLGNQEYDLALSWQNLTVKVTKRASAPDSKGAWLRSLCSWKTAEEINILDNVSGKVRSGNLIAVMGSSGCGKTSLLTAVSRRMKGNVTGKILLCDRPVDGSLLTKISGFVPQQDVAIETLTTREHLQFMARMRLDREVCNDVRNKWIQTLLVDLNLAGSENTSISALSGGERRRLSLAVELLTDPPLLFCDEPTTGLDSYNASTVAEKLRHLASRGKAILCSIHQPTSDILSCFHKIIFLAGGRLAFQGTLTQAHTFFTNQGFVCPPSYNPAEYYIQKLSVVPGKENDSLQRIKQLCDAFSSTDQDQSLQLSIPHIQVARNSITEITNDFQKYITIRKPHWYTQVYWLTWRSIVDSSRNKSGHVVQIAVFLVTSLMLSLCFMNTEAGTQSWIQDIRGLLYLITSEVFFTSAYSVFNTFPREIPVFLRESGLYPASAYYFSKMVTLIPRAIFEPIIYLLIIFGVVEFARSDISMFLLMAVPIIMISNSATAYGCMLSALFESPDMATVVAVPVDLVSLIMAGIFYNVRVLPVSIIWLKYLSQFYYSNEALAVVHWQNVDYIKCSNNTNLPCLENGQQVLDEYGFTTENLSRDLVALALFYIILHFVGFLGVWRRSKRKAAY